MYHSESQRMAIELQTRLKTAEALYRHKRGLNPSFPWSSWGDRPRAGALWTPAELIALDGKLIEMSGTGKLGVEHVSELAWIHGRSAVGVFMKIQETYDRRHVWTMFERNQFF